ncbi:AAA family ATPase [Mesorhizobium sp. BR1-1-16]|uniref:AAA family ATPase n=1 Tax=Mesorhizobium sp. BR1-1-16 TaxID=2876653 RepID=UPI001CC969EC|nr:AAA family ATPase [Mesorhizobium sp. BR1-1-16]MBZ9936651.1 AAA family ATPase [Mesorhizobium sp. BR1-1-16]
MSNDTITAEVRLQQGASFGDILAARRGNTRTPAPPAPPAGNGIDTDIAVDFLKHLDPDGWHHLDHAPPDQPPGASYFLGRTFPPNSWGEVRDYLRSIPAGQNVFYSLNEPEAGAHGTKLRKDDIAKIRVIATDIDLDKSKPLREAEADVETRVERLLSGVLPPSLLVHSGGGRHALWKLNEKLNARTAQDVVEATGRALARSVGGDSTHDINRIFGLPGSINHPAKKKREHGRTDAPVRLLQRTDRRVDVDELGRAYPAAADDRQDTRDEDAARAAENEAMRLYRSTTLRRDGCSPEDLPEFEDLDARFAAACRSNDRLARLWRHNKAVAPKDTSGSGWVATLARQMAEAADFTAVDFARKLVEWEHPAVVASGSYDPEDDAPNGGARQVARAWARIGRSGAEARKKIEAWFDDPADNEPLFPDEDQRPVEGKGAPVEAIRWINPEKWRDVPVPVRQWEVADLIPRGEVTALYGDGATGKSLVMHQYAICAAAGIDWLGQKTRQARVMGFFCEDSEGEVHRRHNSILQALNLRYEDTADNLRVVSRQREDNVLAVWDRNGGKMQKQSIWHQLRRDAEEFKADVIILDTLADVFAGEEQNRMQVNAFVKTCLGGLSGNSGRSVILLAHPSLSGMASGQGTSGSSGWNNSVRSRLYLRYPKGTATGDVRELEGMKANYGPKGRLLKIRWHRGAFDVLFSNAPATASALSTGQGVPNLEDATERAVLFALTECEGVKLSTAPNSAHRAWLVLRSRCPNHLGVFTEDDVRKAFLQLEARGAIRSDVVGKDASRRNVYGYVIDHDKLSAQEGEVGGSLS